MLKSNISTADVKFMLQSEPLYEFIDRLKNLYRTPYQIANQTKFEIQIFQQQILSKHF